MASVNNFEKGLDTPTNTSYLSWFSVDSNINYRYESADALLAHPEVLSIMIQHHLQEQVPRLQILDQYYKAKNTTIMNRPNRKDDERADYRIANNFGKVISQFMVGYMTGNSIQVADKDDQNIDKMIADVNDVNDADSENSDLALDLSKYGRAYELLWRDKEDQDRFALSNVFETFVIYDTTIERKPIMAVRYPRLGFATDGQETVQPIVYTADAVYTFPVTPLASITLKAEQAVMEPHRFGGVPIVEFSNNRFRSGDYEDVIPLIDAYDAAQSDLANYMTDLNDAMLWLNGDWTKAGWTAEDLVALKKANIMATTDAVGPDGSRYPTTAQYIYKQYDVTGTEAHLKRLVDDIHTMSNVPDLNDTNFSGTQSGESMKYKLLGLDQVCGVKAKMFKRGLLRRYKLIMSLRSDIKELSSVDTTGISINFSYNLPKAITSDLQAYTAAQGEISEKTLMGLFPSIIPNPDAEIKALDKAAGGKRQQGFKSDEEKAQAVKQSGQQTQKAVNNNEQTA